MKTYRFPLIYRLSMLLFTLFILGLLGYQLYIGQALILSLVFGLAFLLFAWFTYSYSAEWRVDEMQISQRRLFTGEKSLRWNEIQRAWGTASGGLKLYDLHELTVISIDPNVQGYEYLVETIRLRRQDLWRSSGERFFGWHWMNWLSLLLIAGMAGAFILALLDEPWLIAFALLVGVIAAGAALVRPYRLEIENGSLQIAYLWRRARRLPANEIDAISLKIYRSRNGANLSVEILPKTGASLRLGGFQGGSAYLYLVLRAWWEAQRGTHL